MDNKYLSFFILILYLLLFPNQLFAEYNDYLITEASLLYQYPLSLYYSHDSTYKNLLFSETIEVEKNISDRLLIQYYLSPYSYSQENKKELFKDIRFWKWITLCSSILNFSPFLIMALGGGEEAGIAAGVSHSIWSVCNLALGSSYNKYIDILKKYGLVDTSAYIGLWTAYAAGFLGVITVSFIPNMMEQHNSISMIVMMSIGSALTNLIGGFALFHTFTYESSL